MLYGEPFLEGQRLAESACTPNCSSIAPPSDRWPPICSNAHGDRRVTRMFKSKRSEIARDGQTGRDTCLVCGAGLLESELYVRYRVCPLCGFHYSVTARERIELLADPGTFRETNRAVTSVDPLSFSSRVSYRERIFRDQRRTGLTEAAVTGTCSIGGSAAVLIVLDFGFMGGSMGSVVGEKVALAFEHASKRKRPVIAVVTSGGARIQEGILSLMQMAKTALAVNRFSVNALPFIAVLANPASGQAYASFANLADLILAEPGAIVGLAPMRAIKDSSESPVPGGAHTAEAHMEHGMIDAVVDRTALRDRLAILLDLLGPQYRLTSTRRAVIEKADTDRAPAWDSVKLARRTDRPTAMDYIARIATDFVELHGDRVYGDDGAVVCGLAHLGAQTVMVVGQERGRSGDSVQRSQGRTSPEGFRKAQRAMGLADRFEIPLVTLIDTPGPNSSIDAEQRGLGNVIGATMALMGGLEVPTVAAIVGEGGSEGALALAVADRVLMMENAIYTVISPEDAAGLIYQDEAMAEEVAESLKLTAQDCREFGIVDVVVPEPPSGAHANPDEAARQLRRALHLALAELQAMSMRKTLSNRYKKYRRLGEYSSRIRAAISREVNTLQGLVSTGVKRIARRGDLPAEDSVEGALPGAEPGGEAVIGD